MTKITESARQDGTLLDRGTRVVAARVGVVTSAPEIEAILLDISGVKDCVVFEIPDDRLGKPSAPVSSP